jgi:hypothetical protein
MLFTGLQRDRIVHHLDRLAAVVETVLEVQNQNKKYVLERK